MVARSAGGYAALKPRRLCPLGQANRQKNPFSFSKKSRRGKSQNICKGFFWRGAFQLWLEQAAGLHLVVFIRYL